MLGLGLIFLSHGKQKNTQKKLFMDERSFQRLPPVLISNRILFQVPAVVNQKVYITPALEALFYNANVLVKALSAFHSNLHSS